MFFDLSSCVPPELDLRSLTAGTDRASAKGPASTHCHGLRNRGPLFIPVSRLGHEPLPTTDSIHKLAIVLGPLPLGPESLHSLLLGKNTNNLETFAASFRGSMRFLFISKTDLPQKSYRTRAPVCNSSYGEIKPAAYTILE